jgi:hypothetical protein
VTPTELVLAALAAAVGGAINAIAGGGTLVTFPAIVALGVPPLIANATNTVSLWPGSLGSVWGYRQHLGNLRPWLVRFTIPSLIGGAAGGALLLATGEQRFAQIVPWLVLAATLLFMAQGPVQRWVHGHQVPAPPEVPPLGVLAWQFGVAVYGGYFGAGMGILMLAAIGFMGHTDIHRMNGLKNWSGTCINAVAAIVFVASGVVNWSLAGAMTVGAIVGGYGGARLAQRVGREVVRKAVVAIGIGATGYLLLGVG